jgi:hypothetical protein
MSHKSDIKFVTADVDFPQTIQNMRAAIPTGLGMAGRDVVSGKARRVFDTQNANAVVQKAENKKEAEYIEHMVSTYYWIMTKCADGMTMALRANPGFNAMEQAENPFVLMQMISAAVYKPAGDPYATKRLVRSRLMAMVQLPGESITGYILRVDQCYTFLVLLEEFHSDAWEEFAPEFQDAMFNLVRLGVDKRRNEEFVLLAAGKKPKTFSEIKDFVNEMCSHEKPAAVAGARPAAAAAVTETPLLDADAVVHLVHAELDKHHQKRRSEKEKGGPAKKERTTSGDPKICFKFALDKECKFGKTCRFDHDREPTGPELVEARKWREG